MGIGRTALVVVLAMLTLLAPAGQIESAGQQGLALLTPQEAGQLRLAEEDWRPGPRFRAPSRGPRVVVQQPPIKDTGDGPIIEAVPPVNFVISFEQNRSPVDMDSLEVKAKKGLISMRLTARLKPYIQGASLRAEGVAIPEGRFLIQIEIADTDGARTIETYRLQVTRP